MTLLTNATVSPIRQKLLYFVLKLLLRPEVKQKGDSIIKRQQYGSEGLMVKYDVTVSFIDKKTGLEI